MAELRTSPPRDEAPPTIGELIELVTDYAKQETIGPLRGAGRWLLYGTLAAVSLGIGLTIVLLGVLRLVQTEWDRAAEGKLSWVAYAVVFVVAVGLLALTISRINKSFLNKEPT